MKVAGGVASVVRRDDSTTGEAKNALGITSQVEPNELP
jgi:hypothetical protein